MLRVLHLQPKQELDPLDNVLVRNDPKGLKVLVPRPAVR
jgi:hypothetical protein